MSFRNEKLGSITEIVSGSTPDTTKKEFWDGEINWVTPKDLSGLESAYLNETPRKITQAGLQSCSSRMLPSGSVLFSSRAPIGHVAINTVPMCSNQGFKSFVPDSKKLFNKYLYYWLKANKPMLENLGNGATFKEVSKSIISNVEIPLPPLDEQKRIAAVLDKADEVRWKRRQAIKKLDELLQSVFLDMFGDPGRNSKGWDFWDVGKCLTQKYILEIQDGNHGGVHPKNSDFVSSGIPFIMANCFVNNELSFEKCHFLTEKFIKKLRIGFSKKGDVLLTHKGSVGLTAIVPLNFEQIILSPQVTYYRLNENKIIPNYLKGYFQSQYFQNILEQESKQSTRAYIGITRQRILPIMIPAITEQKKFSNIADKLKNIELRLRVSLSEASQLFLSLQQRAFTGKLFSADDLGKEAKAESLF